ncbi:enoyl-CoA hydratase/isomerase family protein [Rhizorhabdus dicambivorans]|uniref:Enoyl-CoA hydratase/isomerase family protein n=1 Tax=Rhizorhabdus dicambivorans TaxID=1850238 RepID=A0A2A4FYB8_9SPHN|nr:enoyl-CoA hydratase/isomerase family protein [Rhizorhabdus dicambivorans]ATE63033.1 enoyl-CoA hydratase/isomerase family protein [Rhizorhabdus dicambivorans]PCE43210.1 enoyl-CoA hydratase/isomerase family protein [Rhizorhabdus dicambivorans]
MDAESLRLDPALLALPWSGEPQLAGIVNLDAAGDAPETLIAPPFPLIGVGDPAHPLARQVDAVIEAPVTLDGVLRNMAARPRTAAVVVKLLCGIEGLPFERALAWESMAFAMLQGSAEHAAWLARQSAGEAMPAGRIDVRREGERLELRIDRPEARNAIDREMRDALFEAFTLAALDPGIRHIRLTGAGDSFSMGADLAEFGTTRDPATAHLIRAATLPAHMIARCADRLEAHVQGACVGSGLEMAAYARRLTASADAWFQLPELAMGILPGAGGCVSLSRRIGRQRTALLILSGKRINARTALGWGLVDDVVG